MRQVDLLSHRLQREERHRIDEAFDVAR